MIESEFEDEYIFEEEPLATSSRTRLRDYTSTSNDSEDEYVPSY